MKWEGRRQSINYIDMRIAPKTIRVVWKEEDHSSKPEEAMEMILYTDGRLRKLFDEVKDPKQLGGVQNIKIIVDHPDQKPGMFLSIFGDVGGHGTLTTSQKYTLRDLIKAALKWVDKKDITLSGTNTPEGAYLLSYVQSVMNNN